MDELEASAPGDYVPHAVPDADAAAANALRRDMDNLSVRMALVAGFHGTWPDNKAHAETILWHYGSRAIAGDY